LQREAAHQVLLRGLSARETEIWRAACGKWPRRPPAKPPIPNIRSLQDNLSERLGARVQLRHDTSGKGRVVIHYNTWMSWTASSRVK
jgi:ParB family chromosome partitioning protein